MPATIDSPTPTLAIDPLCFVVRGWLWLEARQEAVAAIEGFVNSVLIGTTYALYSRPDVVAALKLPSHALTGFEIFGHHVAAAFGGDMRIEVRVRYRDGSQSDSLVAVTVPTIGRDYRQADFGVLLDPATTAIQREANIFSTGPSVADASPEVVTLLRRYLGPPRGRIIDVGCGIGSYGRGLIAEGYDWLGVDIDPADCAELARLQLPHRQVDGHTLPFGDEEFDSALCLEVLEHIDDPRPFLREVQRVAPRQLLVSVPNCELLSYLSPFLAAPWHMLESTHVNYFTRWSLGALLREFYPNVEVRCHSQAPLRSAEGLPLYYNLFAVATAP